MPPKRSLASSLRVIHSPELMRARVCVCACLCARDGCAFSPDKWTQDHFHPLFFTLCINLCKSSVVDPAGPVPGGAGGGLFVRRERRGPGKGAPLPRADGTVVALFSPRWPVARRRAAGSPLRPTPWPLSSQPRVWTTAPLGQARFAGRKSPEGLQMPSRSPQQRACKEASTGLVTGAA